VVLTEGIDPAERDAMLRTLEAQFNEHNAKPRRPAAVARKSMYAGYAGARRLELVRWELKGSPETWRGQLDALDGASPVFGLVGGLVAGEWKPVHEFCEQKQIPCLFPLTELPVVSGTNEHTLYLSKGLYGQGEAIARFLHASPDPLVAQAPVFQLMTDTAEARALSSGFEATWGTSPRMRSKRRIVAADESLQAAAKETLSQAGQAGVVIFWLDSTNLSKIWELMATPRRPRMVFVSSGLAGDLGAIPDQVRSFAYVAHEGPVGDERAPRIAAAEDWSTEHHVTWTKPSVQSKAIFIGWMLSAAIAKMGENIQREYLLDVMDAMAEQTFVIGAYERVSFGPGQRFASKGCYIVQLGSGPHPDLLARSEWIVN
jgi:hypothetical protein